jgi:hypothetical protein
MFLDRQVPALRGHTPREAAQSERLRPLLLDLIRDLENRSERDARAGRASFDPGWLRKELGLRGR